MTTDSRLITSRPHTYTLRGGAINTYEVTFAASSHAFKNSEIEVTKEKAGEIRETLFDAMRQRKPLVYGRDWDHLTIDEIFTHRVEADEYSIAGASKVAHFYKYERGAKVLVESLTNVSSVKRVA